MRLDGGTSLCHILIEQPSILDFALHDHINGHSIIFRLGLSLSTTPARRKRRTLPSCRPFLCDQSPPVGRGQPTLASSGGRGRRGSRHLHVGNVNVNVDPSPDWLLTQIRPPCSSMNFRDRASPRPVPSIFLSAVPTCRNSSKIAS